MKKSSAVLIAPEISHATKTDGLTKPLLFQIASSSLMGDLEFKLNSTEIKPRSNIIGEISVSYPGRYDGVVINTTISDSNEHIVYKSYNERKISKNVSRLFISRDAMPQDRAVFTALIEFVPEQVDGRLRRHEVKFRASIIEQHKEIESKVIFAGYSS